MKINIEKLEKTLIKNWAEFINPREFLAYAQSLTVNNSDSKVTKLSTTRFELTSKGFIVWIDYILYQNNTPVNITSELFLDFEGNFHHVKSIINP